MDKQYLKSTGDSGVHYERLNGLPTQNNGMGNKFVSIIVPIYRDWDVLVHCVNALQNQSYPKESFEVIIVNNDETQTAPNDLVLPDNFKLITEKKPGSYAARNTGIKIAKGEIIGFTDADCIPDRDWIKNAVNYFRNNKACSRIAGGISIFHEASKPTKAELFDMIYGFPQKSYVADGGACVTANLFTYRDVFDKVGMFDDSLMSGGDILWGKIAHKANSRIDYVEDVMVKHPALKNLSQLTKKAKRYAGGTVQFFAEHKSKRAGFLRFLYDFKRRFKNIKNVYKKNSTAQTIAKGLSLTDKLSVFCIKYYLISIRAWETFRVQVGKKPNRT